MKELLKCKDNSLAMILTGTPGIGKSCFIPILLLILLKEFSVALSVGSLFYFTNKTGICRAVTPLEMFKENLHDNTIFITDLIDVDSACSMYGAFGYKCRVILVTSPDSTKLKFGWKNFRDFSIKYMPSWSAKDVLSFTSRINMPSYDVSLQLRFSRWGGIPRIIFSNDKTYRSFCLMFENCLKDPVLVQKICDRCDGNTQHLYDEDFSQRAQWLSLMLVTYNFDNYRYSFLSPSIMYEVYEKVQYLPSQLTLRERIRQCEGGPFLGNLYEDAMRRMFAYSDIEECTLYLISLDDPNNRIDQLKIAPSTQYVDFVSGTLDEDFTDPSNVLFFPISKSQVSFDCIQPPYIFQITRQSKHEIKSKGIERALEYFSEHTFEWKIVFLIPLKRQAFGRQVVKNHENIPQYKAFVEYKELIPQNSTVKCTPLHDVFTDEWPACFKSI